jgi:hypothetical protein
MRTTVTIDDDVLNAARSIAASRGVAVGMVLSELARKGLEQPAQYTERNGIAVFCVREDAPIITTEQVKRAEDEPW